ncbi:MAG: NitT/TauT family transport system substrate-binding protein [Modestobacter sp.]|jgi:NitT/TauT family transport system substrate-binding protein|nr:NitT/TauT family transport system substrate-binding protein [Modestobacter sp.]
MTVHTRRRAAVAAVAALPLLTLGCGGDTEPGASGGGGGAGDVATVTLGLIPIIDVAPVYLGQEQGFFEEQRIELELSAGQGGAAIVPGIVSGSLDVGFTNNLSLVIASAAGLPLQVVTSGVDSTGDPAKDPFTIVTADDAITRPADLAGKRVAVNTVNAIGDTVVRASVEADGGDPDSIEFVELAFPNMAAAVTAGDVDAAWLVEPFVTIGAPQGLRVLTTPLLDFTDIPVEVSTYATSATFAAEDEDVLARFTTAMEQSLEYAQANPDAVRAILPTYLDMPAELAAQLRLPEWNTTASRETFELFAELAEADGLLTGEPDLDTLLAHVD